jgi:hypothetical protein
MSKGKENNMSETFFTNYREFVIQPPQEQKNGEEKFNPHDYDKHFIVTFSLYDSLLSCWGEANKYEIDVEKSLENVVKECNKKEKGRYYLQVLELEEDKSYFVLALSCKTKEESTEELHETIRFLLEKRISNPLYSEEYWYRLIGEKGRIKRQPFYVSYKEYPV